MLAAEDRAILDFEQSWWTYPGPKDQAIEFNLGLSAAGYYDRLRNLVQDPDAMTYDPLTTRRVRAMIDGTTT